MGRRGGPDVGSPAFGSRPPSRAARSLLLFAAERYNLGCLVAGHDVSEPVGGLAQRVIGDMGVAHGRRRLGMAQQTAHQFERKARGHQMAREGVSQVVDAGAFDARLAANLRPESLDVLERLAGPVAGEQVTPGGLQRGSFKSVTDLKQKVWDFIDYYNRTMSKPFKWTYQGKVLVA